MDPRRHIYAGTKLQSLSGVVAKTDLHIISKCMTDFLILFTTVAFPFMEPLFLWIIRHLKMGKAMDFLAKSASMIIEARKMNPGQDAEVSLDTYCTPVFALY